jgi:elongator complex protein 1
MESKVEQVATFTENCSIAQKISAPVQIYVGLAQTGKLHVSNLSGATYQLATNANSFTVASGYIVYTTTSHEAHFVSAEILAQSLTSESKMLETEKRRVERGSRIVTAVPSNMSLVLQMPRGNLETINPRPLVMEGVRQDIDA